MKRAILYVHGKGGSAGEADRFRAVCPGFDVLGVDYRGELPWEAAPQIAAAYDEARRQYEHIILLANSIGAYFAMLALQGRTPDRALFLAVLLPVYCSSMRSISFSSLHDGGMFHTIEKQCCCQQVSRSARGDVCLHHACFQNVVRFAPLMAADAALNQNGAGTAAHVSQGLDAAS